LPEPLVPFVWQDGVMTDLGTLGGTFSGAAGINDRGQIAGSSTLSNVPGSAQHAFLWQDGVMVDLGTLGGGDLSSGFQINNQGHVVGQARDAMSQRFATLWVPAHP
jgi:probable HAF family extracellular repeat protein